MPNYKQFSKSIKDKYPEYKDVDDRKLAQAMIKKYPEYKERVTFDTVQGQWKQRDPAGFSQLQSIEGQAPERLTTAQEDFRKAPALERMLGGAQMSLYKNPVVQHAYDLASQVGLVPEATPGREIDQDLQQAPPREGQFDWGYGALEAPQQIQEGPTRQQVLQEEIIGPYEEASRGDIPSGIGALGGELAQLAIPGSRVTKISKPFMSGLKAGAISSGLHQAQNIGTGEGASIPEAIAETGLSGVIPKAGSKISPILKEGASRIIKTATKLGKKIKGQKVMNPEQVQTYFDDYSTWRNTWKNIVGSEEKLYQQEDLLGEQFDNLMKKVAKGKRVDINESLEKATKRVKREIKTGNVNLDDGPAILKKIEQFKEMVKPLAGKDGKVPFRLAQNFKRNTLDVMAKYDSPVRGTFDPKLAGKAQAARSSRQKVLKSMLKEEPSMKDINEDYSKMADVRPFIEQAGERLSANRGLSMQDMAALVGGGLGAGTAQYQEKPEYAALSMLPFLLSRGQKSPGVAHLLQRLGGSTGTLADFLMKKRLGGSLGGLGMQLGRSQQFGGN